MQRAEYLWTGIVENGIHESEGVRSPGQRAVHWEERHPKGVQRFAIHLGQSLNARGSISCRCLGSPSTQAKMTEETQKMASEITGKGHLQA